MSHRLKGWSKVTPSSQHFEDGKPSPSAGNANGDQIPRKRAATPNDCFSRPTTSPSRFRVLDCYNNSYSRKGPSLKQQNYSEPKEPHNAKEEHIFLQLKDTSLGGFSRTQKRKDEKSQIPKAFTLPPPTRVSKHSGAATPVITSRPQVSASSKVGRLLQQLDSRREEKNRQRQQQERSDPPVAAEPRQQTQFPPPGESRTVENNNESCSELDTSPIGSRPSTRQTVADEGNLGRTNGAEPPALRAKDSASQRSKTTLIHRPETSTPTTEDGRFLTSSGAATPQDSALASTEERGLQPLMLYRPRAETSQKEHQQTRREASPGSPESLMQKHRALFSSGKLSSSQQDAQAKEKQRKEKQRQRVEMAKQHSDSFTVYYSHRKQLLDQLKGLINQQLEADRQQEDAADPMGQSQNSRVATSQMRHRPPLDSDHPPTVSSIAPQSPSGCPEVSNNNKTRLSKLQVEDQRAQQQLKGLSEDLLQSVDQPASGSFLQTNTSLTSDNSGSPIKGGSSGSAVRSPKFVPEAAGREESTNEEDPLSRPAKEDTSTHVLPSPAEENQENSELVYSQSTSNLNHSKSMALILSRSTTSFIRPPAMNVSRGNKGDGGTENSNKRGGEDGKGEPGETIFGMRRDTLEAHKKNNDDSQRRLQRFETKQSLRNMKGRSRTPLTSAPSCCSLGEIKREAVSVSDFDRVKRGFEEKKAELMNLPQSAKDEFRKREFSGSSSSAARIPKSMMKGANSRRDKSDDQEGVKSATTPSTGNAAAQDSANTATSALYGRSAAAKAKARLRRYHAMIDAEEMEQVEHMMSLDPYEGNLIGQQGRLAIGQAKVRTDAEEDARNKALYRELVSEQQPLPFFVSHLCHILESIRVITIAAIKAYIQHRRLLKAHALSDQRRQAQIQAKSSSHHHAKSNATMLLSRSSSRSSMKMDSSSATIPVVGPRGGGMASPNSFNLTDTPGGGATGGGGLGSPTPTNPSFGASILGAPTSGTQQQHIGRSNLSFAGEEGRLLGGAPPLQLPKDPYGPELLETWGSDVAQIVAACPLALELVGGHTCVGEHFLDVAVHTISNIVATGDLSMAAAVEGGTDHQAPPPQRLVGNTTSRVGRKLLKELQEAVKPN